MSIVRQILSANAPEGIQVRPIEPDPSSLRRWIGPLLLIVTTPLLSVLTWFICDRHQGSVLEWAQRFSTEELLTYMPRPSLSSLGLVLGWTAFQLLLLKVLPGEHFLGPVTPTGERPAYRLNGVAAWAVTHVLLVVGLGTNLIDAVAFYEQFGSMLVTLTLTAFLFCMFLYWKGFHYPSSRDVVTTGNVLFDFFQGVELHPTFFGVSLKQLINCRVSMMGWSAIGILFAGRQVQQTGSVTWAMVASVTVLTLYLLKFFIWEGGYFTSLDIMHDRFGYYICWGVLVWVPAIYNSPQLYMLHRPGDIDALTAVGIILLGCVGIWMNYAADRQRQVVRAKGGDCLVWGKRAETILASYRTTDGETRQNLLLVSGYWGLARHFHYVPELTVALAWSLPAGTTQWLIPYFYFIFLAILLTDRARRDDLRCEAKYGPAWEEYRKRVPYRIVPGIY